MLLWLDPTSLSAQNLRPGHSLTSRSKQFVITSSVNAPLPILAAKSKTIPERVRLTPASLAIFADSVQEQWRRQFKIGSQWQGRLYLHIISGKFGDPPDVRRIPSPNGGWDYRAILPQEFSGRTLTQVIVNLLLREFGGRYAREESTLPPWLTAGTSELILQTSGPILFVPFHTNGGGGINFAHPLDPLHTSRKVIQNSPNVSFIKMSLPPPDLTQGAKVANYRAYSHLLVYKLLSGIEGAKRMQFFLRELPKHKNGAIAFKAAFGHKTMLKVEQWWTLSQLQFRSRDAYNRWRPEIILTHLSDLLFISVATPSKPDAEPQPSHLVPIQDFQKTGNHFEHAQKLNPILQRLNFLQINAPPETARLIQDYRSALETHLGTRSPKIDRAILNKPSASRVLRNRTVSQLDLLDTILRDMINKSNEENIRAKQTPSPPVKVD